MAALTRGLGPDEGEPTLNPRFLSRRNTFPYNGNVFCAPSGGHQVGLAVMESSMALMVSAVAGLMRAPVKPKEA